MRFLHDAARRWSIAVILISVAGGSIHGIALAQSTSGQSPQAQSAPSSSAPATQRLPQTRGARSAQGGAPAATPNRTAAQPAAPATTTPRVASQAAPGATPAAAAATPPAPTPPFQLTAREQELLDKTLARWEEQNFKTKTFKCKFRRWEYDATLTDDKATDHCRSVGLGEVKYKQPDHGMFRIVEATEFNSNEHSYKKRIATDGLDHWVCDGTAIYEFVPTDKKLKVHPLPKEMQGEAIADGPIPFIFGARVDKMKQRYWIRDITPKDEVGKQTWLEIFPKYQHDAVNFSSAILALNDADFSIYGLQIIQTGGQQRSAFIFSDVIVNDRLELFKRDFAAPSTPSGWTREVDPPQEPETPSVKPATAAPATALQPKTSAAVPPKTTKR